jgi:hypothetical protein
VLLLGVCLATLGDAFGEPVARADDAPSATALPVAVGIGSISPLIPKGDPAEMFTISGDVKNVGSTARTISVQLRVSPVDFPYDAATQTPTGHNGSLPLGSKPVPVTGTTWKIATKMSDLLRSSKPQPGVYAVDVVATDPTGSSVLGVQRTFVVWKAMGSGANATPVDVALMWPMVGPPALTASKDPNAGTPLLADVGDLTGQIQSGGRLDQVVRIGKALGAAVNWVVDPDLLYTVGALRGGYVSGGAPGSGAAATAWLDAATQAIKGPNCWNLPNGDPDLTSLAHVPGGAAFLKSAPLGVGPAAAGCDQGAGQTLAWPGSGESDKLTTAAIHQTLPNATALVTNTFYPVLTKPDYATRATLDGTVNALVSDTYLSDVFNPPPDGSLSDPGLLAGQRWLAQTALLARSGLTNHPVIAAPPRDFAPTDELLKAMQDETRLSSADQWMKFTGLDAIRNANPTKVTSQASKEATQGNLTPAIVTTAVTTQSVYSAYLSVLETTNSDPLVVYRTVATSWRGQPDLAGRYSKAVTDQVTTLHNKVRLSPPLPLTLSGKSGKVPITIVNSLPVPVRVNVQGSSVLPIRLGVTSQPGEVVVVGGASRTVQIGVHAVGSGQTVQVTVQLFQPGRDGQPGPPYYPPGTDDPQHPRGVAKAEVRVSAIGIVALTLMIGSAAVLVGAIGVRVYRANRAHHASGHDTMAS